MIEMRWRVERDVNNAPPGSIRIGHDFDPGVWQVLQYREIDELSRVRMQDGSSLERTWSEWIDVPLGDE